MLPSPAPPWRAAPPTAASCKPRHRTLLHLPRSLDKRCVSRRLTCNSFSRILTCRGASRWLILHGLSHGLACRAEARTSSLALLFRRASLAPRGKPTKKLARRDLVFIGLPLRHSRATYTAKPSSCEGLAYLARRSSAKRWRRDVRIRAICVDGDA